MQAYDYVFSNKVLELFTPSYSFILDTVFAKNAPVHIPGTVLTRDIVKSNPSYADFYGYYTTSIVSENPEIDDFMIELPRMVSARHITSEDLTHRVAGMLDVQGVSEKTRADAKMAMLMANKIKENYSEIRKRMEMSAIDVLFDYELVVKGQGVDRKITFNRPAALEVTLIAAGDIWTNTAADIPAQVRTATMTCHDNTNGILPSMAVMNFETAKLFLANTKIQALFNKYIQSEIGITGFNTQQLKSKGIIKLGTVHDVEFYAYDGKYYDPVTKTIKKRVPDNKVAFFGVDLPEDPLISNTIVYGLPPVMAAKQTPIFRQEHKPIMDDNQIVTNMYINSGENPSAKFVTEATGCPFVAQPFSMTWTVA